jgi:hypothetical protein
MDAKSGLEAVAAIRGTIESDEIEVFDAALVIQYGRAVETAGHEAVASQVQTPEAAAAETPTPPTKESFAEQLTSASKGYNAVIDALNAGRRSKNVLATTDGTIAAEFEDWLTEEKLAYVAAAQEADPNVRFTLVATPNVLVDHKDLIKVAKDFGENQPYATYVWDEMYKKYTPQQLSGTDPDNGNQVIFSLIPSSYTPGMEGTVIEQRAKLDKLRSDMPDLEVPSPLEAVTYWQTLRASGDQLADSSTFDRTYIRHFDLPEQRFDDWLRVPRSYVNGAGEPALSDSSAQRDGSARLSVG